MIIRSSEKFCYDFVLNYKLVITNNQIKPHSIIKPLIKIVLFERFLSCALNICSKKISRSRNTIFNKYFMQKIDTVINYRKSW